MYNAWERPSRLVGPEKMSFHGTAVGSTQLVFL